jgi:hypothetical protein
VVVTLVVDGECGQPLFVLYGAPTRDLSGTFAEPRLQMRELVASSAAPRHCRPTPLNTPLFDQNRFLTPCVVPRLASDLPLPRPPISNQLFGQEGARAVLLSFCFAEAFHVLQQLALDSLTFAITPMLRALLLFERLVPRRLERAPCRRPRAFLLACHATILHARFGRVNRHGKERLFAGFVRMLRRFAEQAHHVLLESCAFSHEYRESRRHRIGRRVRDRRRLLLVELLPAEIILHACYVAGASSILRMRCSRMAGAGTGEIFVRMRLDPSAL